ncbi:hypothetical protein [Granulicella arctica]|uniref:hypothetical protein n=1 Tax=Granulicella arctica TaxID=940613 RepID=UPI0021DFB554|nr:hypothetical protein [Granulicella arctica]
MATVLWGTGFVLNAALLLVLIYKRRYRTVPWFTLWVASQSLYTIVLFGAFRFSSKHVYAVAYWSCDFLDVLLQLAVILEIAGIVLRRSKRWVSGARPRLILMGAIAPVIALVMALSMHPAADSKLDDLFARASVFTTVLVFLMFVGVVVASRQLGLGWRSYAMRESYGFIAWVTIGFLTDGLHAYWRTLGHFTLLENVHIAVFQLAAIYWAFIFWLPEPAAPQIVPGNKDLMEALKGRLEYGQRSSGLSATDRIPPK